MSDRNEDDFEPVPVEVIYQPPEAVEQMLNPAPPPPVNSPRTKPNPRHQRLCHICRHPAREAIEQDYLDWRSPTEIAIQFKLDDRAWLDCHARAAGLVELRRRTVRRALERIIERAEDADVNAASIVSAVRTYLRVTDDGRLIEPPTHVHFSVERPLASAPQPKRPSRRPLVKAQKRDRK